MTKDVNKQREELKDMVPLQTPGETVFTKKQTDDFREKINKAPEGSAHKTIEKAMDKGPAVSKAGVVFDEPLTISRPEAELLIRKFANVTKETKLPLDETLSEVKARNDVLREEKKKRPQQSLRIISDLRRTDPVGIKTCGRCAQRVKITEMESKKEYCEICASD